MKNDSDKILFYTFVVVLAISFFVSFSRMKNPFSFSGVIEKILGAAVLLFLIYSLGKINTKTVRKRLSIKTELFLVLKNIIISAVLSIATISAVFLSFREWGYASLLIALLSGLVVIMAYLSYEE